jgi:hypothetical protein
MKTFNTYTMLLHTLHTPRFMLPSSDYVDITHDCKVLLVQQEIQQGHLEACHTLDTLLRQSRDCCIGGHLHTTVPYQQLRLVILMGKLCQTQRVCLGDSLILTCTPVHARTGVQVNMTSECSMEANPDLPHVLVKIYRLFAPCSTEKRKQVPS